MSEPAEIFTYAPDELIFRQGERGDCAYLIRDGKVDISVLNRGERVLVATLGAGEVFGELALIDGSPRSASATTSSGCELVVITASVLERELDKLDPFMRSWVQHMAVLIRKTLKRTQNVLGPPPLSASGPSLAAAPLKTRPLNEVVWTPRQQLHVFDRRVVELGEVIFQEGEPGFRAYILRSGEVQITKKINGFPRPLARIKPNQIFGELALIDGRPRSASATTVHRSELLIVDAGRFQEKLSKLSKFSQYWIRALTRRLRDVSARIED